MTWSARCLHIDLEGVLKGNKFSYRAHIEVSGDESLPDVAVDDLIIQFREDESWALANQAWSRMTRAEDRAFYQIVRNDVMSAYLMKRVRGESIDWCPVPCLWEGRGLPGESRSERLA